MVKKKIPRILQMSLSGILTVVLLLASLPFSIYTTAAAAPSQTKTDITAFQNERWTQIQNEVFGTDYSSVQGTNVINGLQVKKGNKYFNWTDTSQMQGYDESGNKIEGGLKKYSGTPLEVTSSGTVTEKYADSYVNFRNENIDVKTQATYKVYDVYTADQFAWVMTKINTLGSAKLNLLADIDMGGIDDKSFSTGGNLNRGCTLYIEGNGHTVYNLKMYGITTFFGFYQYNNGTLIAKDVGFQSVMLLHYWNGSAGQQPSAGLFFGYNSYGNVALLNVHLNEAYYQHTNTDTSRGSNAGIGLFGGIGFTGRFFMDNCSTSNGYVYGTGHVGGMLSANNSPFDPLIKYDAEFPKNPLAFIFYGAQVYPTIFHNSYSVDCELFSTADDSGAFISCGRLMMAINCFTNNTMYSNKNTGGFIGRNIQDRFNGVCDSNGNRTIASVFRNCYTAGVVEGKIAMGGFTGLDCGRRTNSNPESSGSGTSVASTLYINCYSTTMVGMDYTGKYCGGFVGLDDNWATKAATVTAPDGTVLKNCNGSIYINCYAAGEVGNILTQSNVNKCVDYDTTFYDSGYYRTSSNMDDYYPTGGFIGVLNPDSYYRSIQYLSGTTYGTFYNCYYDKQTTAMNEMAIGLAYAETCRDGYNRVGTSKDNKLVHYDADGNETPFSVKGITGVYTEKSDIKKVAGLAGSPVEYKNSDGKVLSRMSMSGETTLDNNNSDTWIYQDGYYPQIKDYMASDTDLLDITNATADDITDEMKSSSFYIEDSDKVVDASGYMTKPETHSVLSRYTSSDKIYENYVPNTNPYAAQIVNVITPYRYSQASTSTVQLNHWDYKMNTDDGSLSTDNDWTCAVPDNKLTYNSATGYFENTYKSLAAGTYEFKVQANNTMAYNYGSNRFDGQNCVLSIPVENCTAKIMFRYSGLRSQNYQIYAVLTDSNGNPIDENGALSLDKNGNPVEKKILLGGTDTQIVSEVWTLVGMLPNSTWNVTDENYDLNMSPADSSTYTYTCSFTPDKDENGKYVETECQFKIAKDHAWTESYGIAGKSDNMSFKYNAPCTVYFEFNNKTHITKVTATEGKIYKVFTERATEYEFNGLSVIGQQSLTGYNWLESGKELESAKAGQLTETVSGSGIYTVSFKNVKMGANYAYKVIENAMDSGSNSYFSIKAHPTDKNGVCTVTFTYNKGTKQTTVSAKIENDTTEYADNTVEVNSLSVIGSEELTGYFWLGDKDHPTDQSDESKQHYKEEAVAAGLMELVPGSNYLYRKTFYNRPAGTYAFKVGANGSLDMSWGETGSNDNYTFTLTKTANVTVTFNRNKQMISVSTDPTDALDVKQYVVTGTENLMGKTWDLNDAVMTYNDDAGVYEYTKKNVQSGQNYAFKIIEKGVDSGSNISFSLASVDVEYNIKFTYDPKTGAVTKRAFTVDTNEDVTDRVMREVQINSYSVLGDKGLTGYNWLGLTDKGTPGTKADEAAASEAGLMHPKEDGTYYITYENVAVGRNGETKSYPFKIAANGNWDSGISYGDENGDNYMLVLNGDGSNVDTCVVTINFNPKTKKISVETNPSDCNMSDIDDSTFEWYVVGDYQLVSYDSFKASTSVYDTVRDITSNFSFTSGGNTDERGISWSINDERNNASEFKSKMGDNGFTLDYDVDGKQSTGTFATSIIDLTLNVTQEDSGSYTSNYFCNSFSPGKQWLSISTYGSGASTQYINWQKEHKAYEEYQNALNAFDKASQIYYKVLSSVLGGNTTENLVNYMESLKNGTEGQQSYYKDLVEDYGDILALYEPIKTEVADPGMKPEESASMVMGSRNLRLIPTVYLEAGNDADVAVYQDDNSTEASKNVVTYEKNASEDVTFTNIDNVGYSYYNFAFTAGYAITDKIGLGIYDNYQNQGSSSGDYGVKGYGEVSSRDQNDSSQRKTGTYFAMKSVFAQNSSYTDTVDSNKGLYVDTLVKQALIGSSYTSTTSTEERDKQYGQTIVKIYKVNEDGFNSKVNISATASESSEEYLNYLKWTGQSKFTSADKGEYNVTFYWTLADGRYLSDTKLVKINVLQPGISKSVNLSYAEAGNNTLVYNVTYTNSDFASPVTFGVLDVLPFNGDTRLDYGVDNGGTEGDKVSFNLKSIRIKQSGIGTIKGVYYSTNETVRNYLTDSDGKPVTNAAMRLDVNETGKIDNANGYWNDITREGGGGGTYVTENANNATAVAISGIQLGVAESITITITVEHTGKQNDTYVNNAFYMAYDQNKSADICGYSKPVSTNIVGRDMSGYVWYDENLNGVIDSFEKRFTGVKVDLYRADDATGDYVKTGLSTTTDDEGYYSFINLSYGSYKVVVDKTENPQLKTKSGDSYLFDKFGQTKKLLEAKAEEAVGSRNLCSAEKNSSGAISSFYVGTNMPTAVEIYRRSYTNSINAKCDKYNYSKSYLNFGLAGEKCSMTIYKKGQDGQLLDGTSFMLETYNETTKEWTQVKFNENGYIFSDDFDEGTAISKFVSGGKMPDGTQETGRVHLSNLPVGKYRISEVGASEDYAPVMVNFEVDLPFKIKTADLESYQNDPIVNPTNIKKPDYTEGDYSCYRDVTFVVQNAKDINRFLPQTGSDSFAPIFILGAMLIVCGLAVILYSLRRKKEKTCGKKVS